MNDKDYKAFNEWLEIEFGEEVDKSRSWLYEKSIFRFVCEYKENENKKLMEALEFYARPSTWQHLTDDDWDDDVIGLNSFDDCLKHCEIDGVKILVGGKRARQALGVE